MESQLNELLGFLRDRNPSVRQIALSHLLPHTPQGAPHRSIFTPTAIQNLKLLCRDQLAVAHDAFRALVNLSDDAKAANLLNEPSFLAFLAAYTCARQATLADLSAMLLSNLTAGAAACAAMTTLEIPVLPDASVPKDAPPSAALFPTDARCGSCPAPVPYPPGEPRRVRALALLLDAFVQGAQLSETDDLDKRPRKSALHFLANVFANLSATAAGRRFFLTPTPRGVVDGPLEFPLAKLTPFTEHADRIRRAGVASTIKNCAFALPAHKAMLSAETEQVPAPRLTKEDPPSTVTAPGIDVLVPLLLPLAGPEEMDLEDMEKLPIALQMLPETKKREPDAAIRHTIAETLLLLCSTRWGREKLKNSGVYEVIRAAHLAEKDEGIHETIERLVNMLKRPEAEGAYIEDEEELVNAVEGIELDSKAASVSAPADVEEEDASGIEPLGFDAPASAIDAPPPAIDANGAATAPPTSTNGATTPAPQRPTAVPQKPPATHPAPPPVDEDDVIEEI
ncbi:hypothetical protein GGG16DRAFT_85186 [Schizophyllum commune]